MAGIGSFFVEIGSRFSAEGIEAAQKSLTKLGDKVKESEDKYKKLGESADRIGKGMTTVGTSMTVVGGAIVASLTLAANSFVKAGDSLDKMSLRTGISTQSLQELSYAAGLSGASISEVEIALKKMASVVTDAKNGIEGAIDSLDLLGISVSDLMGLSPDEQFNKISIAISKIPDPIARASSAVDIFGRSGTALLPMFADGEEGIRKMREEASLYANILSTDGVDSAVEFKDNLYRLKLSFEAIWQLIGQSVLPIFTSFVASLQSIILVVKNFITEHEVLTSIIAGLVLILATLTAGLGSLLLIMAKVLTSFTTLLPVLVQLKSVVTALWGVLAAHPFVAIVTALSAVTIAALALADAYIEDKTAAINMGKTTKDLIKLHENEIKVIKQKMRDTSLSLDEQKRLQNNYFMTLKALKTQEAKLEKETADKISKAKEEVTKLSKAELLKQQKLERETMDYLISIGEKTLLNKKKLLETHIENVTKGSEDEIRLLQEIADTDREISEGRLNDHEDYAEWMKEIDEEVAANREAMDRQAARSFVGAWRQAFEDYAEHETAWKDKAVEVLGVIETELGNVLSRILVKGEGFETAMKNFWQGISDALVKIATELLAKEIIKNLIKFTKSLWGWATDTDAVAKAQARIVNQAYSRGLVSRGDEWAEQETMIPGKGEMQKKFWEDYFDAVARGLTELVENIIDEIGRWRFAGGIRNFAGGIAMVGEAGREIVRLPAGSDVYSNPETERILAGDSISKNNINVYVTGNNILDDRMADRLAERVSNSIYKRVKNNVKF